MNLRNASRLCQLVIACALGVLACDNAKTAGDSPAAAADTGQNAAADSAPAADTAPAAGADSANSDSAAVAEVAVDAMPDNSPDAAPEAVADTAPDAAAAADGTAAADAAPPADTEPDAAGSDAPPPPQQCATVADCPAAPACQVASCGTKGLCAYAAKADGQSCDDGNACSTGDVCTAGTCAGPNSLKCDDENPCTADKCNPLAGCINLPTAASAACDDGNACTAGDGCLDGKCQAGVNICQCETNSDCGKLEDGNLCNGTLYCDKSAGAPYKCAVNPASLVVCDTSQNSGCQQNTCIPSTGKCELVAAGENTPCSDGDKCTAGDYCEKGLCHAGTNTCYCKENADCKGLEDGNMCNGVLYCNKATAQCVVNPVSVVSCQTVNDTFCSRNTCNPKDGKCYYIPFNDGKACDDGNACTPNEQCTAGECKTATNTCECQSDKDCGKLEDGNLCNGTLYCDLKTAKCAVNPASIVHCNTDDDPQCLTDVCNAKTGQCEALALPKDGTACSDGNPCTPADFCKGGQCVATANTCECEKDADCAAKEDGNLCNGTLYCDKSAGKCVVNPATVVECPKAFDETCLKNQCEPKTGQCGMKPALQGNQCPGSNACMAGGWCNYGACETSGQSICACQKDSDCIKFDDGDLCNGTMYCDQTGATPVCNLNPATVVVCGKGQDTACVKNQCAPDLGKCAMVAVKSACDDGNPCTTGDLCAGGNCLGGAPLGCSDGNACTSDKCVAGFGCVFQPVDVSVCDDNNACTGDSCEPIGGCQHKYLSGNCSDGSPCTTGDVCKLGNCKGEAVDCDDANPCSDDSCKDEANGCVHLPNAATCSDGSLCTAGDQCSLGKCQGGAAVNCSDGNPCTADSCAPKFGCQYGFAPGQCDDSNQCTQNDACKDGACGGNLKNCDDGNPCTDDACDPKVGCQSSANSAPCSDGNACTTGDACAQGKCAGSKATVCNDGNPCTDDGCDAKTGCVIAANSAPCDDGNACTQKDACSGGKCAGVFSCDDSNKCTDEGCDGGQCVSVNNSNACNDGNACTTGDKCSGGKCGGTGKLACDDGNVCTDDSCDPSVGCNSIANSSTCDDGNACTANDACKAGNCTGAKKSCDDGNLCTDDGCDVKTGCTAANNTAACDDGSACTANDACASGQCAGKAKDCDDKNACTADSCLPATGQCVNADTTSKCNDGNPCTDDVCNPVLGCGHANNAIGCSDGNPCTTGDVCKSGNCAPTGVQNCDDGVYCTDDSCDPKQGCVNAANTKACDDGVACTKSDACKNGLCAGVVNCDDSNACTDDSCDYKTGKCVNLANTATCSDNNDCTTGDACKNGACTPAVTVACDDGNVCTDDYCDKVGGCKVKNNAALCEKPGTCVLDDSCSGGTCSVSGSISRLGVTTDGTLWTDGNKDYDVLLGATAWDSGTVAVMGRMAYYEKANESYPYVARVRPKGPVAKPTDIWEWKKSFADMGTGAYARSAFVKPDGKLVVGGAGGNGVGKWVMVLLKDGTRESFFAPKTGSSIYGAQLNAVGYRTVAGKMEYVMCGGTTSDGQMAYVGAISESGALVKETTFGYWSYYKYDYCAAVFPADDAGAMHGFFSSNNSGTQIGGVDIVYRKLKYDLTVEKEVHFGTAADEYVNAVAAISPNDFILVGATKFNTADAGTDGLVMRINPSLQKVWDYQFGGLGVETAWGVTVLPDHTAVVVGSDSNSGDVDKSTAAMRFTSAGALMWNKVTSIAQGKNDEWFGVCQAADGDLRIAGYANMGATIEDFAVARMDPWGAISCSDAGACGPKRFADCSDGNDCTDDYCDFTSACKAVVANANPCEDGDACTLADKCTGGKCATGAPAQNLCDDANPCTSETCLSKQCIGWPCDGPSACSYTVLPEGTVCGAGKTCQTDAVTKKFVCK